MGFSGAVTLALCIGREAVPGTSSSPLPHQALKPSIGQDHTSHSGSGLFLGPTQYHGLPFWPPLGQSLAIFPWQRPLSLGLPGSRIIFKCSQTPWSLSLRWGGPERGSISLPLRRKTDLPNPPCLPLALLYPGLADSETVGFPLPPPRTPRKVAVPCSPTRESHGNLEDL